MNPFARMVSRNRFRARALVGAIVIAAALAAPRTVAACAMCVSASDQARTAYYATTALLAFLPFVLFGAIVYGLRRVARAQDALSALSSE